MVEPLTNLSFEGNLPQARKIHVSANSTWTAWLSHGGKSQYLGTFKDEVEAAKAWDMAARQVGRSDLNFTQAGTEAKEQSQSSDKPASHESNELSEESEDSEDTAEASMTHLRLSSCNTRGSVGPFSDYELLRY